ncbi:MAG: winged helix-turn-helix domain-containing protein [Myxococcota bacterium]|nr:winged helix-turn-helix domain-containing protein [Myxococcota bacterium]
MVYAFGGFELDGSRFELRHEQRRVAIEPKPLDLLLHLVRNRDRVVGHEELRRALWPDTTLCDGVLARSVWAARRAVGDDGARQAVIRTCHRRGYRFVAPLDR